ncbi:hypothetical protein GCM10009733_065000 [Nonomuraea maheshkhaliensis]|uniref:Uncharacterized protein n=1 Tax=Nonomuraea maheshkhaliensis TaxID=419590 RepID=A0ABN2FT56_9ACTN
MQPVEIRLVERGVAGYEVAESRHDCIMRAFPRNNQTGPRMTPSDLRRRNRTAPHNGSLAC